MTLHLINLVLVTTSRPSRQISNSGFSFGLLPDCLVYTKDYEENKLDFSHVDFVIEFKKLSDDPFIDDPSKSNSKGQNNPFLCEDGSVHMVLGQITTYATAILSAQYRAHLFMILIVGEYARLIRWDRSGAVITNRIHFDDESHLFDFLVRYDIASPEDRGHDSTISPPSEDEIKRAKDIVPEFTDAEA